MKNLARKQDGEWTVPPEELPAAAARLAAFETFYQQTCAVGAEIDREMEKLRSAGKIHTLRFRELMGRHVRNQELLERLRALGIE